MKITVPEFSLVVLVGASGSGKSTFARRHFRATEILSSDAFRGWVSDDENDQAATPDAFDVLHYVGGKRLAARRLCVVDATNVQESARKSLIGLAREHDSLVVAIVFDLPESVCRERNRSRPDRSFGPHVVRQQTDQLRRSLRRLKDEGFRHVTILRTAEEVEGAEIERVPLWTDRRSDHGPFDVIGDVHGCIDELKSLLEKLGYSPSLDPEGRSHRHPDGRKAVFLGDLVDRGPDSPGVLRLVMAMVAAGDALCVPGNHDVKLLRKLRGADVKITHGLAETLSQLEKEPPEFHAAVAEFVDSLVSHFVLDDGRLVVAHAGLTERFQGRASGRVRAFALYGETTGENDEYGLPIRYDWASEYRGPAHVIYGHTPALEPTWTNRTICIDTGCVFGGKLTALRMPEKELVQIQAARQYYAPVRPLVAEDAPGVGSTARPYGDLLDIQDVLGKRIVETRIHRTVTIREENSAAALEVMSRFATDPHWVVYLPPTMSPSETCPEGDRLEHPREAFAYFRSEQVARVICQEKHMGSRAIAIVGRNEDVGRTRFGAGDGKSGVVYTRTGRPFFADAAAEAAFVGRVRTALDAADFWSAFETDWACLDGEILPWSAKAEELLRTQYAAVGSAASAALDGVLRLLERATGSGRGGELLPRFARRREDVRRYVEAYGRYCWKVDGTQGLGFAPFHLLATEGRVHTDRDHGWHVHELAQIAERSEGFIRPTPNWIVDLADVASENEGIRRWEELTERGGEGMVVKPLDWIVRGRKGLVQPALKCRGREYLRIIYGPEYTEPEHLVRLRSRGLAAKRSLAIREYALGLEGLHRFVEREPLYRVHECVFGVLALESEPVDPRL